MLHSVSEFINYSIGGHLHCNYYFSPNKQYCSKWIFLWICRRSFSRLSYMEVNLWTLLKCCLSLYNFIYHHEWHKKLSKIKWHSYWPTKKGVQRSQARHQPETFNMLNLFLLPKCLPWDLGFQCWHSRNIFTLLHIFLWSYLALHASSDA